jgi:hypothetical protein
MDQLVLYRADKRDFASGVPITTAGHFMSKHNRAGVLMEHALADAKPTGSRTGGSVLFPVPLLFPEQHERQDNRSGNARSILEWHPSFISCLAAWLRSARATAAAPAEGRARGRQGAVQSPP